MFDQSNRGLVGRLFAVVIVLVLLAACDSGQVNDANDKETAAGQPSLVVYTSRKEHLIKPLFDIFSDETGITVNYITDKAGPLIARLAAEGNNSQADILMTVDAGNLWQAAEAGLLASLDSPLLKQNVPEHLRDPQDRWFALTVRSRTIVYSTDRVKPEQLSSYEALAGEDWRGRLCLRTSKKVYNQSLVATMIAALGEETAENVVKGWVANLAMAPLSNDTKVMEAILAGQCDVGIVNSYYFGRLEKKQPDLALALYWPNQQGRGAHINISGAAVTNSSQHKAQAQQLIEWLTTLPSQQLLVALNQEYAVNPGVELTPAMKAWGEFKADRINVSEAGRLQTAAVKLMDRAGYR